tara:strand:- start:29 stop:304 length:276 start_codon:yes stop_codon:yes gene_type:complete
MKDSVLEYSAESLEYAEEFLAMAAEDKADNHATVFVADSINDDIVAINLIKQLCASDPTKVGVCELVKSIHDLRDQLLKAACEGFDSGALV